MNLNIGETYDVVATQILTFGVVVELEDKTTQLVHISNIADEYIADVGDYVSVGKHYSAMCQEGKTRPLELSLRHLGLKSQATSPKQERSYSSSKSSANLDEMIDAANASYADKQRSRDKKSRKSRR